MSKQEYVTGFLFDWEHTQVALIQKTKPAWQAGRYNGIGGKVEPGETLIDAMRREFWEETGLTVENWDHFVTLQGQEFNVHFYRSFICGSQLHDVRTTTEEPVKVLPIRDVTYALPKFIIPNLKWLIPMALSMDHDRADSFVVNEVIAA
jgi:8-oxo-dGTP diphosphatase